MTPLVIKGSEAMLLLLRDFGVELTDLIDSAQRRGIAIELWTDPRSTEPFLTSDAWRAPEGGGPR